MKKYLLLVLGVVLSISTSFSALSVGDIAFVQYNADGTDDFAFVTLVDIPAGEIIKFTDNEENDLSGGEGTITWTAPSSGVSCGTIVSITTSPSASIGSVTESNDLNFAGSGDGIIAYQGTSGSPTFITALGNDGSTGGTYSGSKEGNLPSGLTLGINAQSIAEIDNAKYNGSTLTGSKSVLLNAIYDFNNWSGSNSTNQTFSGTFDVTSCSASPTITVNPSSLTGFTYIEGSGPSAEQTFTVEGSNLSADINVTPPTNWEISSTSGGPFQTTAIILVQSGGTVASTTIYTRMVSGLLNANSPFSGNITCTSTGATQQDVAVDGTVTLPCVSPTTDASLSSNSSIAETTATLNWTNGNGSNRIVVLREINTVAFTPSTNTTYTANSAFGVGTDVGTAEYVVYNGNSTSVNITALTPGTVYFYTIYEYNCTAGTEMYYTSGTPETGTFVTEPENPTLTSGCISNTSIDLTWTAPTSGNFNGYLLVVRENANPHSVNSLDPNTALGEDLDYSVAATYGTTSPNSRILYKGTGTTATITGLTSGISYKFKIFTYATDGTLFEYSTGTLTTKTIGLLNVNSEQTSTGNTQLDVSWSNPAVSCYDEIMVVANEIAGISFSPSGNGSVYTANNVYAGVNSIVYKGTGNAVTVTGLTNGTTYYFEIFVRKGTEWSSGVEIFGTPNSATILERGDLAIIAVNTNIGSNGKDELSFVCFKDITPNTKLYLTDNGYQRRFASEWGGTEGVINITRTGSTLAKGTVITIRTTGNVTSAAHFDIYTCGVIDNNWTKGAISGGGIGGFNLNSDDDMWIMQGGVWSNSTSHHSTYSGNVLYGWTESGWDTGVGTSSTGDTKWSSLYPNTKCFTTIAPVGDGKVKFDDPVNPDFSTTTNDALDWIALINNTNNWVSYSDNSDYDNNGYNYFGSTACPTMTIDNNNHMAGKWLGTNNNNWYDCSNWDVLRVPDETVNVVISNTASNEANFTHDNADADLYDNVAKCNNLTIQDNIWVEGESNLDTIKVRGNLIIEDDGLLDLKGTTTGAVMMLAGDFTNNDPTDDAFDQDKSTVIFNGTAQQDILTAHSSNKEDFYDLKIAKTAQSKVNLNDDVEVTNVLTFESGIIKTNTNEVYVSKGNISDIVGYQAPNSTGAYANDKYVEGNLAREITSASAYEFPVGDAPNSIAYNPVVLTVLSGTGKAIGKFVGSDPGTISVNDASKTCSGSPVLIHYTTMTGMGYWNFTSATTFNYNIMLHPNIANTNTDPNSDGQYRALKAPSGTAGGSWPTSSGTDGDFCVVSSNYFAIPGEGYSGFSDFAPGGGTTGPALPVELLYFNAEPKENTVLTSWSTATEINNDYFTVERSKNGIDFKEIGKVKGAGNSNNKMDYRFIDKNPYAGISYYRLKQTDFDGAFEYSDIKTVSIKSNTFEIGKIYPNPSTTFINIPVSFNTEQELQLTITNVAGKIVFNEMLMINAESKTIQLDINRLTKGMYYIKTISGNSSNNSVFIKD